MRTIRTVRPFDVEADTIGTLGGYWFVFDGLRRINGFVMEQRNLNRGVWLLALAAYCAALLGCHPPVRDPPSGRFVFEKTNRVILELGGRGSFDETNAKYPCVLKVGSKWWMWYNGRSADSFTGEIGLATSPDGLRWTKANGGEPVLRHGPPSAADSTKVDHPAVVRFGGRLHMWFTMGDEDSSYTIGYATSTNGKDWTRQNGGQPVFGVGAKGQFDDQVVLHPAVVRDNSGKLHLWYMGNGPQQGFRLGYATSSDGIHWTRENGGDPVVEPETLSGAKGDVTEEYVYNCMVLLEGETFDMWYSAGTGIRSGEVVPKGNCIRHASSTDGVHWVKDPEPTLFNGPLGSIDEYAAFAPYVVRRDVGLWMYYSIGHIAAGPEGEDRRRFRTSLATQVVGKDR